MSSNKTFPVDRQIVASIEVLRRDHRLDPNQYNERGERIIRHLKQLGIGMPRLGDLRKEVYLPNRFSRIYLEQPDQGVPMLGTSTMLMTRLPLDSRIKIDGNFDKSPLRIQSGDILISRSGTVGTTVLCGESYGNHAASDDCIRLRVTEDMRGFITAYLQCEFGRMLLTRDAHGKVIRHLKEKDVCNVRVPMIESSKLASINKLMLESAIILDKARKSLALAETELCRVLGIEGKKAQVNLWINRPNRTFVKASNALVGNRLDPHFYDPEVSDLRNRLARLSDKTLGEIADVWGVSRFKRMRADKGYGTPLFSSADIMRTRLTPSAHISTKRNLRNIKQCRVEEGAILVPCSGALGGIIGRCIRAGRRLHGQAVTQHVLRIKVADSEYIGEYVAGFLGSLTFGYPVITSFRYGKDVPELDPEELKTIPVPKPDIKSQEKIAGYIRSACGDIDVANDLVDDAEREMMSALQWTDEEEEVRDLGEEASED